MSTPHACPGRVSTDPVTGNDPVVDDRAVSALAWTRIAPGHYVAVGIAFEHTIVKQRRGAVLVSLPIVEGTVPDRFATTWPQSHHRNVRAAKDAAAAVEKRAR
ncbi:hypothetical protein CHO01_21840 [Cellulomonas hominis]|uniref:Phosphoglucomutase n=1 Tax=Cellulomonas hominis TaxID=156981 RepID=A0A511FGT5_9CELL|nr:hypothetical protein [Cellulomonas hominis]MBB5474693.1 phosphoglucomutase [Cellulomonas hominis]NKY05758.1 hypothetical protein [Cellulomonas hominis]GEL47068.1 hypothetical protein CHO01_21840 [Cellulomonas hominis]